ncbi:ABC transporter ATP-binding protein [Lachnospiraceae bacterium ZAX-1]
MSDGGTDKVVVEVKDVSKTYENSVGKTSVLKHIDLTIKKGELVGIVGDSGSGKTTLLNLIGGMDSASGGSIVVSGKNITNFNDKQRTLYRRNQVGFIFQDYNLINELTVYENMIMPLQLKGVKIDGKTIDTLLEKLKLQAKKNNYPMQLSGGEQQRAAILRSLISQPDIILADEATGNLDSVNTGTVINLLKYFANKMGRTILFVTHNNELAKLCDRIITIKDGKIV